MPLLRGPGFAPERSPTNIIPGMSSGNVELVKQVLRHFNRAVRPDESEDILRLFSHDVVIDMSRRVFNPDTYEGHDGLRRLGRGVREVWDEFTVEPERFVDAGSRVVVIERRRGRGRESEVEVETRSAAIWTLRDGKVIHLETDLEPNEALRLVGKPN